MRVILSTILTLFSALSLIAQIDSIEQNIKASDDLQVKFKIADDACFYLTFSDFNAAQFYCNKAIDLANELKNDTLLAQAYNDFAILRHRETRYSEALQLNRKALKIREKQKDIRAIAASQSKIGMLKYELGQYDSSAHFQMAALKGFEQVQDSAAIALSCNNIAELFYKVDPTRMSSFVLRAIRINKKLGNDYGLAGAYGNYANRLEQLGNLDSALYYQTRSYELYLKLNLLSEAAANLNNIGYIERKRGNDSLGLKKYEEAYSLSQQIKDTVSMAYFLKNIAAVHQSLGTKDQALKYYRLAQKYAVKKGLLDEIQTIAKGLSEVFESLGMIDSALHYSRLNFELRDSIYSTESLRSIQELEQRFENEKKEKQIAQLNEKQAQASLAIATQRNWIIALLASLTLVLVSAWFVYDRRKKINMARIADQESQFRKQLLDATVIAQEEERQRIAKDLHDGLVQTLAALKLGIQNGLNKVSIKAEAEPIFKEHIRQLDDAANEARGISHQMMPRSLTESGLVIAMEDMLDKTLGYTEIEYHFEHFGMGEERLKQSIEVSVYRIAQELVNNVIKHSKASHVDIQLFKTKSHLVLHVEDDGAGFELSDKQKQSGIGLSNIFSRASAVNGEVNYEKGEPKGTIANVRVPL